jgi:hypothetical protein
MARSTHKSALQDSVHGGGAPRKLLPVEFSLGIYDSSFMVSGALGGGFDSQRSASAGGHMVAVLADKILACITNASQNACTLQGKTEGRLQG